MFEIAGSILATLAAGRRLAVATVIEVDGSAPRALGTSMAVDQDGAVIGSISGGCVEGSVYDACDRVLATGQFEVEAFGFTDDDAFAVGLSCGGRLKVIVQELAPSGNRNAIAPALLHELRQAEAGQSAGIVITVGPLTAGGLEMVCSAEPPSGPFDSHRMQPSTRRRILTELRSVMSGGQVVERSIDCDGVETFALFLTTLPPARMIIFGAVDFSASLAVTAGQLGYRVTVCDARPVFATQRRFPGSEVVVQWPSDYLAETDVDERTVICILTHDDKFDVPLIETALELPAAYVGAMGSRTTHRRRMDQLRARGIPADHLARLHSPIGLDIGASTPDETAVSILAEIIAARQRASGRELRDTAGPIHSPLSQREALTV